MHFLTKKNARLKISIFESEGLGRRRFRHKRDCRRLFYRCIVSFRGHARRLGTVS